MSDENATPPRPPLDDAAALQRASLAASRVNYCLTFACGHLQHAYTALNGVGARLTTLGSGGIPTGPVPTTGTMAELAEQLERLLIAAGNVYDTAQQLEPIALALAGQVPGVVVAGSGEN